MIKTEAEGKKFNHLLQKNVQFKIYKLFVSGISYSVCSGHS